MKRVKSLNKYDDVKLAEIRYGLEGFYLQVTKLIIIFALALLLKIGRQTLIFIGFSFLIRTFSSGFHANSSFQCLVISILIFIGLPILANYIHFNVLALCIIYFCLAIGYFILAPKDSIKKPIVNNKKRFWLKIISVIIVIIYFIVSLLINNEIIINLMTLALLNQLLMLSPIPYWMFGQKYNFKWFK